MLQHIFLLSLLAAACTQAAQQQQEQPEKVCKSSFVIKSLEGLDLMRNCTIIVGHVRLVNMDLAATTSNASTIAQLNCAVEEITDYLLVYRVQGLQTLRYIFPRLTIIRGQGQLLYDAYALVVYENRNLLNLGLLSLLRIQKGDIRIEENPLLCYVNTVNWVYLLRNSTMQRFSLRNNKSPNHCTPCSTITITAKVTDPTATPIEDDTTIITTTPEDDSTTIIIPTTANNQNFTDDDGDSLNRHCWDLEMYQGNPTKSSYFGKQCQDACGIFGCKAETVCCNPNCLTECTEDNCKVCAGFKSGNKCVDSCPFPYYQFNKRECVNATTCRKNGLIPHAGVCMEKCPEYHVNGTGCNDTEKMCKCEQHCAGNYVISLAEDLNSLKDCTTINGSLTIKLTEVKSKIVHHLDDIFMNIKEIRGYLKIIESPQLFSLNFLRNLHSIRGEELVDNIYALYVVNNRHLEHIWSANQQVAIYTGRVFFHLNPSLCYAKILQLQPSLMKGYNITILDASPSSNGERVICNIRLLNATVEDFNATAALIKVSVMPADDKELLIGYSYHYMEAPIQNITMYDGRHGCGRDNWLMDITATRNIRHIITNLKPYTQYAYFVKTITMTDYHRQISAYSKIQYFRTLPSRPSAVAKIYSYPLSENAVQVYWWPPLKPNGVIKKYILYYKPLENGNQTSTTKTFSALVNTKKSLDKCHCIIVDPLLSGPMPKDENYYSKEQITYDEALPDIIFISRNVNASEVHEINDTTLEERHIQFENYRKEWEAKAIAEQDTGIADFSMIKPPQICPDQPVSTQLENSCRDYEIYKGTDLPGYMHSFIISNLESEARYNVSVRACAAGLDNGCGRESIITVETLSKKLRMWLKS